MAYPKNEYPADTLTRGSDDEQPAKLVCHRLKTFAGHKFEEARQDGFSYMLLRSDWLQDEDAMPYEAEMFDSAAAFWTRVNHLSSDKSMDRVMYVFAINGLRDAREQMELPLADVLANPEQYGFEAKDTPRRGADRRRQPVLELDAA